METNESGCGEEDEAKESIGHLWRGFGRSTILTPMPDLHKVKKIALGQSHALVLTEDARIFGVGSNSHGQLGNGKTSESMEEPIQVVALDGKDIVNIACGPRHSGAVSSTGDVYMWGNNESGQCSGEESSILTPMLVQFPAIPLECVHGTQNHTLRIRVLRLSCGDVHTAALSDEHEVWVWGSGVAMGLLNVTRSPTPQRLDFLRGRYVIAVVCGGYHSIALVSNSLKPDPLDLDIESSKQDDTVCPYCKGEPKGHCGDGDGLSSHVCPLGLPIEPVQSIHESSVPLLKQLQRFRHDEHRRSLPDVTSAASRLAEAKSEKFANIPPETSTSIDNVTDTSNNAVAAEAGADIKETETVGEKSAATLVRDPSTQDMNQWEVVNPKNLPSAEETAKYPAKLPVSAALKAKLFRSMSETAVGTKILTTARSFDFGKEAGPLKNSEDNAASDTDDKNPEAEHAVNGGGEDKVVQVRRPKSCHSPPLIDTQSAKEFLAQRLSNIASAMSPSALAASGKEPVFVYEATTEAIRQNVSALTSMVVSGVMNTVDRFGFVSKPLSRDYEAAMVDGSTLDDQAELLHSLGFIGLEFMLDEGEGSVIDEAGDIQDTAAMHQLLLVPDKRKGSVTRASSLKVEMKRKMSRASRVGSLDTAGALQGEQSGCVIPLTSSLQEKVPDEDEKALVSTEVWSWGRGNMGQLGQGDALDRLQPCAVNVLRSYGIIKVAAGLCHSVALSAGGQVYAWGYNSHGQLGNPEYMVPGYSPQQIKLELSALVWDIAAGSKHTVLLADRGVQTEVYYCGKQEGPVQLSGAIGTTQPMMVSVANDKHIVRQVFAGGFLCGCISDDATLPHLITVRELAASERCFYRTLTLLRDTVLEPFTKDASYLTISGSAYGSPIEDLLSAFGRMWEQVALNNLSLGAAIQKPPHSISIVTLIDRLNQWIAAFEQYTFTYYDLYAVNGLMYCAKTASSFFSKTPPFKQELSNAKNVEDKSLSEVLARLLEEPIRRIAEYQRSLDILSEQYKQTACSNFRELEASKRWGQLVTMSNIEKKAAERTRNFWESCPQKLADSVRSPNRRILRDSKSHPLTIASSGRFSSNWFILLSDVLVLSQFSGHTVYNLPLIWVDPVPDTDVVQNAFTITMPEETLHLQCPTPQEKTEWICALNQAIRASLTKGLVTSATGHAARLAVLGLSNQRLSPPLTRTASHTFVKKVQFKEATYMGTWLCGKLHGHGELSWPDGRKYTGKFKQNIQCGDGLYVAPSPDGNTISEGTWKDGKMNGLGSVRYPNGDLYEGYFRDGLCHGHGILKKGQFLSSAASIYIGEWAHGQRNGYGVMDDIVTGEKYMGMWQDDCRHGNGMVVNLDGVYYEGNFGQNKMTGQGLMMFEDNSWYEGEFGNSGFGGKGVLTLATGDKIEGNFYGLWNEGIKVNGTFWKSTSSQLTRQDANRPSSFGQLSVPAERKWTDIFQHCQELLGVGDLDEPVNSQRVWETVAVIITDWKKKLTRDSARLSTGAEDLDGLDTIPQCKKGTLTVEDYHKVQTYLARAFESSYHPLGKLMEGLVDVYRATYIGVGAHPRLLSHAVEEVHSFISRIYTIVRLLFPDLPPEDQELRVRPAITSAASSSSSSTPPGDDSDEDDDTDVEVVTASGLILPVLLPRIYPPLFTLYALNNEKEDDKYWETLLKWNKQSDLALMAYLGVDHKFWFTKENERLAMEPLKSLSSLKDQHFSEAVDALQHLSTTFSPTEKLRVIHRTFQEINKGVQSSLGEDYVWTMDDLFPVFQYVVVRARIRHLGSEVLMIDDLMEPHLQHGELGIMFTTLKACYFQVQKEQMATT